MHGPLLFATVAEHSQAQLFFGFVVFCAFIVYDTQKIVAKFELGDRDYVAFVAIPFALAGPAHTTRRHALDLFLDVINVFRHLLVILTKNVRGCSGCGAADCVQKLESREDEKKNKRR